MYKIVWFFICVISFFQYVEGQQLIPTSGTFHPLFKDKDVQIYYAEAFDQVGRKYYHFYAYNFGNSMKYTSMTFNKPVEKNAAIAVVQTLVYPTTPDWQATQDYTTLGGYIEPSSGYYYLGSLWQNDIYQPLPNITPSYSVRDVWIDVPPTPPTDEGPTSSTPGPGPVGGSG